MARDPFPRVVSLGSGSTGNVYCLVADEATLMIDCGLCCKSIVERSEAAGVDLAKVCGVLFTHSHIDHVKGAPVFHKRYPDAAIFANFMTAETIAASTKCPLDDFACFENGQEFSVGPFTVMAFSIPHDTSDPVGYLVRVGNFTYYHATDVGTPLDSVGIYLREADAAILESNHDPVMLAKSGRAPSLIQRISGPRGHLCNDEACGLVKKFASPRLKRLGLAHLSRDCNMPHIAEDAMRETLDGMGRGDVVLKVLGPDEPITI